MQDILIDTEGDIIIESGDFVIGESTGQEVTLILKIAPGGNRENGYLGMDLANELDEDGGVNFKAELKKQLKLDNKRLKQFIIDGEKLSIDVENL